MYRPLIMHETLTATRTCAIERAAVKEKSGGEAMRRDSMFL
jgi:hypothetical protein